MFLTFSDTFLGCLYRLQYPFLSILLLFMRQSDWPALALSPQADGFSVRGLLFYTKRHIAHHVQNFVDLHVHYSLVVDDVGVEYSALNRSLIAYKSHEMFPTKVLMFVSQPRTCWVRSVQQV